MSLDYKVCIKGISLQSARQVLLKLPGFREFSALPNPHKEFRITHVINGPGIVMWLDVTEFETEDTPCEPFISAPYVEFLLRANKFFDDVQCCRTIANIVRTLLENSLGDALFYFTQSDRTLLYRQGGTLFIDDEPDNFWFYDSSVIEALGLEYTRASLPTW